MGGAGQALCTRLRRQEGRHRLVPLGVVAAWVLLPTADRLNRSRRADSTADLAGQEKPVGMLLRSQLETLEVEWPTSLVSLRPGRPKRKKPRPHQRRAIRDCVSGLTLADRGQLVMACGTGKTLIGPFRHYVQPARNVSTMRVCGASARLAGQPRGGRARARSLSPALSAP